jgi:hypothetical protein
MSKIIYLPNFRLPRPDDALRPFSSHEREQLESIAGALFQELSEERRATETERLARVLFRAKRKIDGTPTP